MIMKKSKILDKAILISEIVTYITLIIALIFLSTFYRTGLFVFLLILLIALPPTSYLAGRIAAGSLSISLASSTNFAQIDDKATLSVRLKNDSIFPLPDCHITYEITSTFYPCDKVWEANCPSYGKSTFSLDLPLEFHRAGCYQVRCTHLRTYDYLHIFHFDKKPEDMLEIRIYPPEEEIQPFEPSAYGEGFDEFEETSAKGNTSSNVTDIREYIPGDRLQKIHWKLSAKIDKLMVKENEHTSSNQFTILAELYLPAAESDLLDASLKNAYSLSRSLIQAGQSFFLSFYNAAISDFTKTLILDKEQLDAAFLECFYLSPYPEEDLALSVYQRAGFSGGTLLHVSHKGIEDVIS